MAWGFRRRRRLPLWAATSLVAGLAMSYFASAETLTIHVEKKTQTHLRKEVELLVFTPDEIFKVVNSWTFFTFDRREHYTEFEQGRDYRVVVAGWSPFDVHREIVEILD